MIIKFKILILLLVFFIGCGKPVETGSAKTARAPEALGRQISIDELAELERAGAWYQGMALAESGLRENAGDIAGAVAAAYKELSWAYGMGIVQKTDVEQGLRNLISVKNDPAVSTAAEAALAFSRGQWSLASDNLSSLVDEALDPDGFGRWMMLTCALEKNHNDEKAAAAYKSIRARYAHFPEFWYRGARVFRGNISAEYAENCINTAPNGPFTDECRRIIAAHNGLVIEDASAIMTKSEIDRIVSQSVNSANPKLIDVLFPLIELPDNPYTMYAVNVLRGLSGSSQFREYLNMRAALSQGRLAERLSYICRG
jgi:hypothetical protein